MSFNDTTVLSPSSSLQYPCSSSFNCYPIVFALKPGTYKIEAYGASSQGYQDKVSTALSPDRKSCPNQAKVIKYLGNTECLISTVSAGAGAYISGEITLKSTTKVFAHIGGMGKYLNTDSKGGYNGGGDSVTHGFSSSSGGGATDIRFEVDDLWHRVLVAGGGGGTDDETGNGGSGGYPSGQGFWRLGTYNENTISNQTSGYSFGIGENGKSYGEAGGGGGGWFGGFSSNDHHAAACGGSSFILKSGATIPSGLISGRSYAFTNQKNYYFTNSEGVSGIWKGNGMIRITMMSSQYIIQTCKSFKYLVYPFIQSLIMMFS